MTRANGFHRRAPRWCWALLALTAALVLPGKEVIYGQSQPEAQPPARADDANTKPVVGTPMPMVMPTVAASLTKLTRTTDAIPLKYAAATDVAVTINGVLEKKLAGKKLADNEPADIPAIVAEPVTNHVFVSAVPQDLAVIKRLVAALDIAPKQYLIEAVVYEAEPLPTGREAIDNGKFNILCRPQILTIENQTAFMNSGDEVESPVGSGQRRSVGVMLQVTVGHANDKQVPVRAVTEFSSVSKDRSTINIQHLEHTANFPLGERTRLRGGTTNSGKELWFEMTVTEVTSREQLEKLTKDRRIDK